MSDKESFFDTSVAKILGFVADLVGVVSAIIGTTTLLISSNLVGETGIFLPASPYFALCIWMVAAYLNLAWLHSVWTKEKDQLDLSESFWDSLKSDFVIGFVLPQTLTPTFILMILFLWIYVSIGIQTEGNSVVISLIILFFLGFLYFKLEEDINDGSYYKNSIGNVDRFKCDVRNNWPDWEKRISLELHHNSIVHTGLFTDISDIWNVDIRNMEFVFARYANTNPEIVRYGSLIDLTSQDSLYPHKVLCLRETEILENQSLV